MIAMIGHICRLDNRMRLSIKGSSVGDVTPRTLPIALQMGKHTREDVFERHFEMSTCIVTVVECSTIARKATIVLHYIGCEKFSPRGLAN